MLLKKSTYFLLLFLSFAIFIYSISMCTSFSSAYSAPFVFLISIVVFYTASRVKKHFGLYKKN